MPEQKILAFRVDVVGASQEASKLGSIDAALAKLNQQRREALKIDTKTKQGQREQSTQLTEIASKTRDLQAQKQKLNRTERLSAQTFQASKNSISALRLETAQLRRQAEGLNLSTAQGRTRYNQLTTAIRRNTTAIRNHDRQISGSRTLVGEYGKGIVSSFKSMALSVIGFTVALRILRGVTNIIVDFDQQMARVRSIVQATDEDFEKLKQTAQDLGGTTKYTATQVAELQVELGKLGFAVPEILKMQASVLSLAAAFDTDLARAAEVTGITLRQFKLDASETGRVVDVMTQSFIDSPLDIERFAEAMKYVGPAAEKTGISLEQTTVYLQQLAQAGLFGTNAGTALRQIMLALAKESGTFSEKLSRAAEEGLTLADAADEVQKRAAVALLVLADGVKDVEDFTTALENAGGTADRVATQQLDTLRGRATILVSALQRLTLTLADNKEAIEGTKGAILTTADGVNLMADAVKKDSQEVTTFEKAQRRSRSVMLRTIPVFGRIIGLFQDAGKATRFFKKRQEEATDELDGFTGAAVTFGETVQDEIIDPVEEVIINIELLEGQLKSLKEQRDIVPLDEVPKLNRQIEELEQRIRNLKSVPKEVLPEIKKVTDALGTMFGDLLKNFDMLGGDEPEQDDPMTAWLKNFGEALLQDDLDNPVELTRELLVQMGQETQDAFDRGLISFSTYTKNLQKIQQEIFELDEADTAKKEKLKQSLFAATERIAGELFQQRYERNRVLMEEELARAGDNEKQKEQIRLKYARKEQKIAVAEAGINAAQLILHGALTKPFIPAGLIAAASAAIIGGIQIAKITKQKFARSGVVQPGSELPQATPEGDNTLVLAKPGEVILNKRHQRLLGGANAFRRAGVPGFAASGIVPEPNYRQVQAAGVDYSSLINNIEVSLNVNKLHKAEKELSIINQSTGL